MIAVDIEADGRRGRVFFGGARVDDAALETAVQGYMDEDDTRRATALEEPLRAAPTAAVAYPTVAHPDVIQVYIVSPGREIYACSVITEQRLRTMLSDQPWVIEGFTLQVAPVEHMSVDALRTAVQAWHERNFPDVVPGRVLIDLWTPSGVSIEWHNFALRNASSILDEPAPEEVDDVARLTDRPFQGEAA